MIVIVDPKAGKIIDVLKPETAACRLDRTSAFRLISSYEHGCLFVGFDGNAGAGKGSERVQK
jgi:hypothetical protein